MRIEDDSFDPAIREDLATFRERLEVFPEGFVLLEVDGRVGGYLCSELWDVPRGPKPSDFALGHSARERHRPRGNSLYISSYGILSGLRGRGLGRLFFRSFQEYSEGRFPHDQTLLLVSETWRGARAIYESEGYAYTLTVPGFFRFADGTAADGLVMRRPRETGRLAERPGGDIGPLQKGFTRR